MSQDSGEKKLGVLVRGAGWVAGEHIKAFLKNPNTEIKHIDARFQHEIDGYFEKFNFRCDSSNDEYEKALERDDIDIVTICTISHLHAKETMQALKAGKHVFVEKPAVLNIEELHELNEVAKKSDLKAAVGFVVHWYPAVVSMKSQLDKGALGDLFFASSGYWHEVHGAWKATTSLGGSSLLMGGCHAIDLVRWFVGMDKKIEEVFAYANGPVRRKDFEYPPNIYASMKFDNGVIGNIGSSLECNMPYVFGIELLGTRGAIRGNKLYSEDFAGAVEFLEIPGVGPDSPDVSHHPFDSEIDEFVEWVRGGKAMDTNLQDAIHTHQIIFASEESARTGKPIKLESI